MLIFKVKVDGPGLKPGNKAGKPCKISIDSRKAGKAKTNVEVVDEVGNPVKVDLVEEEPGLFSSTYYPEQEGKYKTSRHLYKRRKLYISPTQLYYYLSINLIIEYL